MREAPAATVRFAVILVTVRPTTMTVTVAEEMTAAQAVIMAVARGAEKAA